MRLRIAQAAERDLQEIGDWFAQDDPVNAARFTDDLIARALQIASMPLAFPAATVGKGLRKRSHRRYIIYYRVGRTTITIARILHQSRDQGAQFRTR